MTTLVELKLQQASFRGVTFLWENASTDGGRKNITHEFPNSNRRVVEDLGLLRKTYNVTAIIYNRRSILDIVRLRDYYTWRDSLISSLEAQGPGELIHPLYGSKRVSVIRFSVSESQREIGVARINIVFQEAQENIFPLQQGNNASSINRLANSGISSIGDGIRNGLQIGNLTASNLEDLIGKGRQIANTFEGIRGRFKSSTGVGNAFFDSIRALQNNAPSIVQNPLEFGQSVEDLFNESNAYGDTAIERFNISTDTYDFGNDDIPEPIRTIQIKQRGENRNLLNESIQAGGLIQSYRNVPLLELSDEEIINDVAVTINNQFNIIDTFSSISDDTINIVKELRVQVSKFLKNSQAAAFRIEEVETNTIPLQVLTYQYYGNLDNFDRIVDLNPDQDPVFAKGKVKVLTR